MSPVKRAIDPDTVPKPAGIYSNGLLSGPGAILSVAGQVGIDANGQMPLGSDITGQTRQCFANVLEIVKAAGGSLADIVSLTIHVTDIADMKAVNDVRAEVLNEPFPASTMVQVTALAHPMLLVEVTAMAVLAS